MGEDVEYNVMVPPLRSFQKPERFVVPDRYKVDEKTAGIGSGAFGAVITAYDTATQTEVAIKKCTEIFKDGRHTGTLRELVLLHHFSGASHPNIVRLRDFFVESHETVDTFSSVYLVMDKYTKSLRDVLRNADDVMLLNELRRATIIYQLLEGLQAVHKAGFIHRDIKPENMLIRYDGPCDTDVTLAICDFGSGRDVQADAGDPTTLIPLVTTMSYMPPEGIAQVLEEAQRGPSGMAYNIIKQGTLGQTEHPHATEVWGVACIMWELITAEPLIYSEKGVPQDMVVKIAQVLGQPPAWMVEKITNESLKKKVLQGSGSLRETLYEGGYMIGPDNPDGCSEQELDLLCEMLLYDPAQRTTIDKALHHRFFNQLEDTVGKSSANPTPQLKTYTDDIHHKLRSNVAVEESRRVMWEYIHTAEKLF